MPEPREKLASTSPRDLVLLLKDIESRSLQHVAELPQQHDMAGIWEGILFMVRGIPLVAPLKDVKEILNFPSVLTRVPGVRSWLLGVANIRGNLLPVIDLQLYLGGEKIVIGKRSRILVIDQNGIRTGLLVAGVQGLRHFKDEQGCAVPTIDSSLGHYVHEAFNLAGEVWPVFSIQTLVESSDFQVAAA